MLHDTYLDASYVVETMNAKELSSILKKNLKSKGIDYTFYNSQKSLDEKDSYSYYNKSHKKVSKNPPIEIYEYQQFFLMRMEDDSLVLLDGFRRLLWYAAPDYPINVRIYDYKTMDEKKIIKLLIYLNHFKFVSNIGEYYDRGFGLALNTLFDLNIPLFYDAFDAYLSGEKYYRSYSSDHIEGDESNTRVKERIMHPLFISDMQFIQTLSKEKVMVNSCFGALTHSFRTKYPDVVFDADKFINIIKSNTVIKNLYDKYLKAGDTNGSKSQEVINQLIDLYINVFNEICGVKVEKTYADKMADIKEIVEKLKKDKSLFKVTNFKKYDAYWVLKVIVAKLQKKEKVNFDFVVYPIEKTNDSWDRNAGKKHLLYGEYKNIELSMKFLVIKAIPLVL